MENSKIEWCDNSWNPIVVEDGSFYCEKVSRGCENCYAEILARRVAGMRHKTFYPYKKTKDRPQLALKRDILAKWADMKVPKKNFVTSMSDVFGEFVPEEWVFEILDAMIAAPIQIFQVVTKRAVRMRQLVNKYCDIRGLKKLPNHIWLIVTVEQQKWADERIYELAFTRCTIRGISAEPLLEYICLDIPGQISGYHDGIYYHNQTRLIDVLDWVILGGESGNKKTIDPTNPICFKDIIKLCKQIDVPVFFKQWGEWVGGILDKRKGKAILEDGTIFWTNPGHPKICSWDEEDQKTNFTKTISARVGKKPRNLSGMDGVEKFSNNGMINNLEYKEFPHYLNAY